MITKELYEKIDKKYRELRNLLWKANGGADFSNAIIFFETSKLWLDNGFKPCLKNPKEGIINARRRKTNTPKT